MKIIRVEAIPVKFPLKKPMLMGGRSYTVVEAAIVRLVTSGRHAGWGEASIAPFLTGETLPGALAAIERLDALVTGRDASELSSLGDAMQQAVPNDPSARAAVEVAWNDALAREKGIPLHRMIAPDAPPSFPCIWLVGNSSRERDLAEVLAKARDGFRCFKLKVANGDTTEEARTLIDMRDSLGDDALICADANTAWTVQEAIRFVQQVEKSRPQFVEQPVGRDDFDGLAQVARASSVPIGADESMQSVGDVARLLKQGIVKGGSFKILKFGGLSGCLEAARVCLSLDGSVNLSGKLGESSIANAAALALAGAIRPLSWALSLTNHYLEEDIVKRPIAIKDGRAALLEGPGLGIEIDEEKLARLSIRRDRHSGEALTSNHRS